MQWRTISSFGYVFGALFALLGLYGYLYYKTTLIGTLGLAFTPYQNYAIPLVIAGIALLIAGYAAEKGAKKKTKSLEKQQTMATTSVCPDCGEKRDLDAQYCKKCGKKFQ